MKRKLLTQIKNEWTSNVWFIVQLAIAGIVLSGILIILGQLMKLWMIPTGFDADNTVSLNYNFISEGGEGYVEDSDNSESASIIFSRLRALECVEALGVGVNAYPYSYSYFGSRLNNADGSDTLVISGNVRQMTPDLVKVLRLKGVNGETPEELSRILARGELLVSVEGANKQINGELIEVKNPSELAGREVYIFNPENRFRIGAVIENFRRNDFEDPKSYGSTVIKLTDEQLPNTQRNIVVRLKPGTMKKFIEYVNDHLATEFSVGNVYLTEAVDVADVRSAANRNAWQMVAGSVVCSIFLLASIFLGQFGTFWYRTRQRVQEIAIRKVSGATNGMIFRRLLSEGMLMLLFSIPFVVLVLAIAYHHGVGQKIYGEATPAVFIYPFLAAECSLALMVLLGLLFPARVAMKIDPATALKDE